MEGEEEGNSQRESRVVDPRGVVGMKDTPGLVAGLSSVVLVDWGTRTRTRGE